MFLEKFSQGRACGSQVGFSFASCSFLAERLLLERPRRGLFPSDLSFEGGNGIGFGRIMERADERQVKITNTDARIEVIVGKLRLVECLRSLRLQHLELIRPRIQIPFVDDIDIKIGLAGLLVNAALRLSVLLLGNAGIHLRYGRVGCPGQLIKGVYCIDFILQPLALVLQLLLEQAGSVSPRSGLLALSVQIINFSGESFGLMKVLICLGQLVFLL